jgi:hypothetical protein
VRLQMKSTADPEKAQGYDHYWRLTVIYSLPTRSIQNSFTSDRVLYFIF